MPSTRLFVLFSFLVGSSQARNYARRVIQERATYQGGWALGLSGTTCPADASVSCGTNDNTVNPTCCPSGQTCFGLINPHCCPSDTDCSNVVSNFPTCANSTWDMYALGDNFFCCEPGQIGVIPINGQTGICEPSDQQVPASRIATPASQIGGAAVTTSGSAASSTQSTLTSTLTNGGVTTITTAVPASTVTATSTSAGTAGYSQPAIPNNSVYVTGLSLGAKIGLAIAFGVAVILFIGAIVWCYRRRRARREKLQAALIGAAYNSNNQGGQAQMQQGGQTPQYMQTPPQPYSSPAPEYKYPNVGVSPVSGYGQAVSPQTHEPSQGNYVPPTPQYPGGMEPVEAPQAWERGVELGPGK